MRISRLSITNFRGVQQFVVSGLKDTIVIAGPNGCGKSCVLDAIRLLKSCYGGYQPNEMDQWFNEFQFRPGKPGSMFANALGDPRSPLRISAEFSMSPSELDYVRSISGEVTQQAAWYRVLPKVPDHIGRNTVLSLADSQARQPQVDQLASGMLRDLEADLESGTFLAEVIVDPDGKPTVRRCPLLEVAFSTYEPKHIGVIDYHGANRTYGREQIGGVNLNIETDEQQQRQHALYNYAGKYQNIKSQMAGAYVRDLISREAGGEESGGATIIETLQELFRTFFPGKRFLGPRPTPGGGLDFPVEVQGGVTHDINDLSSGEKEVVFGYLRLRNTTPRNSILLLDEPELHLNPRLARGLPQFYQKHLGKSLGNQLWLVTHSDAFLRQTIDEPEYSVFHMHPPAEATANPNQAQPISVGADLERAVIEMVGDLASYRPGSKVVILEGEDSEFDAKMVGQLFPEFVSTVSLISAGNSRRVQQLHSLLEAASKAGKSEARYYSVIDRDYRGHRETPPKSSQFMWDVFHIENYLLNPDYLLRAVAELTLGEPALSPADVRQLLLECASEVVNDHVRHELETRVFERISKCIDLGMDPGSTKIAAGLGDAARRSVDRMNVTLTADLATVQLEVEAVELRGGLLAALDDGTWSSVFRGRDIIRRFVGKCRLKVPYEAFRNLVIARMKDDDYQPSGMKQVLARILES